jgi:hypothetical protein
MGFQENQNLGFSGPGVRELKTLETIQDDRANNSVQNETSPSSIRPSLTEI